MCCLSCLSAGERKAGLKRAFLSCLVAAGTFAPLAGVRGRPTVVRGSFKLLVIGR